MVRSTIASLFLATALSTSTSGVAQDTYGASDWDQARQQMVASGPGRMAGAIARWEQLTGNSKLNFEDYANFLVTYPGLPDASRLQGYAEARLREQFVPNDKLVAFFDRYPPKSNFAKAHYALAIMGQQPQKAQTLAREAWRGGEMSDTAEASLAARYGAGFTQDDQDARMDALLWQRDPAAASRQLARTSPARQPLYMARLAILQGGDGATQAPGATSDPGYLYNRSRELRLEGNARGAVDMLANRPKLASLPFDQTLWVEELLQVARMGGGRQAVQIAASIDDAFEPGADISTKPYKLRDDYTSLMWLGGTKALWDLGDARSAAPLFYRYGAAARTPQTRSKGFFWAGQALSRAGNAEGAKRYYEMAAEYPDRFYGLLALDALGRPVPQYAAAPQGAPTAEERAEFNASPLTAAVTEVARDAPWRTGIRFYREIADQAETVGEHMLVADLARNIGRRDLAVNLLDSAEEDGHQGFVRLGFPTLTTPPGTDWTMVHAIARQESQFAQNAISHAGARGLMQLMPATAREESEKAGITYMSASLIDDAGYNMRLGSNHFQRNLSRYGGSYPLAIAAYNAGPGNVNKWLRENGDPRTGAVDWLQWIEEIPFYETKNYVQRVIENAAVYETLYPEKTVYKRSRKVSDFLR